jgi:hypothetical protein
MLRGGQRYYLPTASHAAAWGVNGQPTSLSPRLIGGFPQSTTTIMPLIATDSDSGKTYLMDGTKHELTGVMLDTVTNNSTTLPTFTSDYFNDLATASSISTPIIRSSELGDIYSFDNGLLYHVPNGNVLNALGYPRKYTIADISRKFTDAYTGNVHAMSMFVQVGATTYFMQDGNLFPISSAALSDWTSGSAVPTYSSQNLSSRFDFQPSVTLGNFIQEGNDKYIINNGTAFNATGYAPTYLPSGVSWKQVSIFGMPRSAVNSPIVRSTDTSDSRIFVLSKGTKQHILTGEALSALTKQGSIGVLSLSPALLGNYPQVNGGKDASPLIYTDGQGFKLLSPTGTFFSFADADTVVNFAGGNLLIDMDGASYSSYSQQSGTATRLIKDPSGKVYWVENGKKRWITSGAALQPYSGIPMTNVSWSITNWLPDGAAI